MATILDGCADQAEQDALDRALHRLMSSLPAQALFRDYYQGDHRLVFATSKFRETFGSMFAAFADNLCPAVVDAVADRLQVQAFSVGEGATDQDRDQVWAAWQRNLMDLRAGEVHTEALRQGRSGVLVWQDERGKAVLHPQRADQVVFDYDQEVPGRATMAVKAWRIDTKADGSGARVRVNVYTVDQVRKYVTKSTWSAGTALRAAALVPFRVDGEAWPLAHAMGVVPLVPFVNGQGRGTSELRDVIPLQDALNKAVADMMVAMEYVALPQRWATGIEVPVDPETGKPVPEWRPSVERLLHTAATDARFGQFDQADLSQFLRVQDGFRAEVGRVSATPFHYLMLTTGDFPSGEAMKTAEQRFVSKVRDRMRGYGAAWGQVASLVLKVESSRQVSLVPDWVDPSPGSLKDHLEALKVKRELGIPRPVLWRELDYTEDEIADMEAQAESERVTLADSMAQALNAGM